MQDFDLASTQSTSSDLVTDCRRKKFRDAHGVQAQTEEVASQHKHLVIYTSAGSNLSSMMEMPILTALNDFRWLEHIISWLTGKSHMTSPQRLADLRTLVMEILDQYSSASKSAGQNTSPNWQKTLFPASQGIQHLHPFSDLSSQLGARYQSLVNAPTDWSTSFPA